MMTAQERLRASLDVHQQRLLAGVPVDREAAITALVRNIDRLADSPERSPRADLIFGQRPVVPGGNKALQICLESTGGTDIDPDTWAERCLQECGQLAAAERVIAHCESSFMRMAVDGDRAFNAWIATKRPPASWHERADFDWWAGWLTQEQHAVSSAFQPSEDRDKPDYRRVSELQVATMAHQISYPPEATIGGCTIRTCCEVLTHLIARALSERDRGGLPGPQSERALAVEIASMVPAGPNAVSRALAAFTLDGENASYHAAVPGVAAAPLVRVDADRVVWSLHGLLSEPLLFLSRELRHRFAQEYHDSALLREGAFRNDLYKFFQDKRFVTSVNRIELRRVSGDVRTDIDAAIFDRKTGTLAFFELKSQDPFARSTAELARQRDNLLYANRQISGVLTWLNRSGAADDLLNRVDQRTAKTFRVQKVYPFVLGRYLAHFPDGFEPDRRAAWGSWPQLLRLLNGQPATGANPLATLFARLSHDTPPPGIPNDAPVHQIQIGADRLTVFPSYAAYQARTTG